jgi:hypothetical protein
VSDHASGQGSPPRASILIAWAWLAIMLSGGAITSVVLPPFQAPDEPAHFMHAAEIAAGAFLPRSIGDKTGGLVDHGYVALVRNEAVNRVIFRHWEKFNRAAIEEANSLRTQGTYAAVPNVTSYYFATGYLPQAAGMRLAALFTDRVMIHLIWARLVNCIVASALIVLAFLVFPPAMPVLIAVSALPMSLFVINSASQDALLVGCSILLASLSTRLLCATQDGPRWQQPRWLAAAAFAVVLVLALGRPSYVAFAAIPAAALLLLDWRRHTLFAIAGTATVLALLVSYIAYVRSLGGLFVVHGADYAGQLQSIRDDPTVFLRAYWLTLTSRIGNETIGIIGWGDTPLPWRVYPIAKYLLAGAVAAAAVAFAGSPLRSPALSSPWSQLAFVAAVAVTIAGSVLLTGLGPYLNATPVGDAQFVATQGRYFVEFLPVLLCGMLAPLLAAPLRGHLAWLGENGPRLVANWASVALLGAMMASFAIINLTMVDRYYLK